MLHLWTWRNKTIFEEGFNAKLTLLMLFLRRLNRLPTVSTISGVAINVKLSSLDGEDLEMGG
jgi:hypothetical protein